MFSIRVFILSLCAIGLVACGNNGSGSFNSAPAATAVTINDLDGGQVWVGDQLFGNYTYNDADGDLEGATAFSWYRNGVAIVDANARSYIIAEDDVGQQLSLEVVPAAQTGLATGMAAYSDEITVDYFIGSRPPPRPFTSAQTGRAYTVSLYLPPDYAASARDYPVVYEVTNASGFNPHADILDAKARQVILVSVDAGDNGRADATMPGARNFYDFFVLELIPFIDAQYRADKVNRTLVGHSLAGLFVGLAMLFEPPDERNFSAFISSDGSFWDQPEETIALEQQLADRVSELPVTLILTAATGNPGNEYSVTGFLWLLSQRNYEDFDLIYMPFDLLHTEVYDPSLRAGIDILFP